MRKDLHGNCNPVLVEAAMAAVHAACLKLAQLPLHHRRFCGSAA
jgi:hypothetical protein